MSCLECGIKQKFWVLTKGLVRTVNPFTPVSDQERISLYNINTESSRQVMRIKKISIRGLLVDPIPNPLNWRYKNCIADSREDY